MLACGRRAGNAPWAEEDPTMSSGPEASAFCQELVWIESLSGREEVVAEALEREMRALVYDKVRRNELAT